MDPEGGDKILCAGERISYYSVLIIFSKCKVAEKVTVNPPGGGYCYVLGKG